MTYDWKDLQLQKSKKTTKYLDSFTVYIVLNVLISFFQLLADEFALLRSKKLTFLNISVANAPW